MQIFFFVQKKYHGKHQTLYEKRHIILSGEYEPTADESDYSLLPEEQIDESRTNTPLSEESETDAKVDEEELAPTHGFDETTKGVPKFWLTIFKNVDRLSEMIQDHDEPILEHLNDIRLKFIDEPMGFSLEFHFAENNFFTNSVLTKTYELKCKPDDDDPFRFEGPEIIGSKGCTVDWKKDKNVTVKVFKNKRKSKNAIKEVTKSVQKNSFFNFFNPPASKDIHMNLVKCARSKSKCNMLWQWVSVFS